MSIIQCLLYCMSARKDECALAPQLLAICLSLGFFVPSRNRPWWFLLSICWIHNAFEVLHLFYKDRKKNPISSSVIFAQSLTYIFLTLSGKSQDSPYTAQGEVRKVLFGEGNQSLSMLISFPTKNLKETEVVERQKSFFFSFCSVLADFDCPWGECGLHVW